jgi:hypothetical protein
MPKLGTLYFLWHFWVSHIWRSFSSNLFVFWATHILFFSDYSDMKLGPSLIIYFTIWWTEFVILKPWILSHESWVLYGCKSYEESVTEQRFVIQIGKYIFQMGSIFILRNNSTCDSEKDLKSEKGKYAYDLKRTMRRTHSCDIWYFPLTFEPMLSLLHLIQLLIVKKIGHWYSRIWFHYLAYAICYDFLMEIVVIYTWVRSFLFQWLFARWALDRCYNEQTLYSHRPHKSLGVFIYLSG